MGVLDQLLEYKKYKDAQNNADLQAIPQAAMLYQQGKQQQLENTIKTLTLQGTLAKSGIGIGPNNQLVSDNRFNNDDLLDTQLKKQRISSLRAKESLYNKMLSNESNGLTSPDAILNQASQSSGLGKEDFNVKPITRMVAGVPHTAYVPELKKELPSSARKIIDEINPVKLGLKQNLDFLEKNPSVKKYMTPAEIRAHKGSSVTGFIGNLLLKVDPSKDAQSFGVFKAETDKIFQKFRKETTGAQAALKELGWLAPDFPEADDNPELYKAKAVEALKRIDEGYNALTENYSAQGYRTSELKKVLNKNQKQSGVEIGTERNLKGGGKAVWDGKGWRKQ